jgi:hypothetical protein
MVGRRCRRRATGSCPLRRCRDRWPGARVSLVTHWLRARDPNRTSAAGGVLFLLFDSAWRRWCGEVGGLDCSHPEQKLPGLSRLARSGAPAPPAATCRWRMRVIGWRGMLVPLLIAAGSGCGLTNVDGRAALSGRFSWVALWFGRVHELSTEQAASSGGAGRQRRARLLGSTQVAYACTNLLQKTRTP